jgi:hypothetical protein
MKENFKRNVFGNNRDFKNPKHTLNRPNLYPDTSINAELKLKNEINYLTINQENEMFNETKSLSNAPNHETLRILSKNENLSLILEKENALNLVLDKKWRSKKLLSNEDLLDMELTKFPRAAPSLPYKIYPTMKSLMKNSLKPSIFNLNEFKNRPESYFKPFDDSNMNSYLTNSSFTQTYMKNLKSFLYNVFTYQSVSLDDIHSMSPGEKKILCNLINGKDYCLKQKLIDNLYLKNSDFSVWQNFYKLKRKEENLKYSLKLIFKNMQNSFAEINGSNLGSNSLDSQMYFYIYYFGHLEFSMNSFQLIETVNKGLIPKNKIWKKLGKYILPEMGIQSSFSIVKSISKRYLHTICKSKKFLEHTLPLILDSIIFMSYCWNENWECLNQSSDYLTLEKIGIKFLKTIGSTNKKEILKLFKEWENQVIAKETYIDVGCSKSIKKSFEVIKSNAKRKNLKFPWSFKEIHCALIECFLVLSEYVNADKNFEGKFNSN